MCLLRLNCERAGRRFHPARLICLALVLLMAWPMAAAGEERIWVKRTPQPGPRGRFYQAMAYDSARERVVLFGGWHWSTGLLGDTWEWDGLRWTEKTPAVSPPARSGHALAYDSTRQRVVLFGGGDGATPLTGTWEWDGSSWIERTPVARPPARARHALAYDSVRQRVVLFGGYFGNPYRQTSLFGDTWEWDGEEWTERAPLASPPARRGHGMAYDSARDRIVLYGGYDGISLDETWEWDGENWEYRGRAWALYWGRHDIALAYDDDRQRILFYGGRSEGYHAAIFFYDELWEWDGSGWTYQWPDYRPWPDSDYGLAYDSARREVVLTQGPSIWIFRSSPETICDGADDNDNGLVDEGCDDDGDGWCDSGMILQGEPVACPAGGGDCNDGDDHVHPWAGDLPGDRIDQDCDGTIACNPRDSWPSHGQFVGCIARECNGLVRQGHLSPGDCAELVRNAARGEAGR